MSRILALAGAVVMIAAAIFVRAALDDDDDTVADRPDGASAADVVCVEELASYCPTGGVVEGAAVTADRLAAGALVAAWLTFDPWPSIVDDARDRAGLEPLFEERAALAASPLVAVGPDDRDGCDWACLFTADLRIGGRAYDSGLGLLHLGVIAGGVVGTTDFATNDLVPEVRSRLAAAVDATQVERDPVLQLLRSRAFFDVALSTEAEARRALDAADPSRKVGLALLYPAPVANAVVVAAGDADLLDGVAGQLAADGWTDGGVDAGLPNPGVLSALRGLL